MPHVTITDTYPDKDADNGTGLDRLEFEVETVWDSWEHVMNELIPNCAPEMAVQVAYEWGHKSSLYFARDIGPQRPEGFEVEYLTGHGGKSVYAFTRK